MEATKTKTDAYVEAVGRRKTSTARVRITRANKSSIVVNDKDLNNYFPTEEMRLIAVRPLKDSKFGHFSVSAKIIGGGIHSQSEAMSHAIARALIKEDVNLRKELKKDGFLKRDARMKERRKFGLKKARKSPKWSKR